jgi:hypothetical protein
MQYRRSSFIVYWIENTRVDSLHQNNMILLLCFNFKKVRNLFKKLDRYTYLTVVATSSASCTLVA